MHRRARRPLLAAALLLGHATVASSGGPRGQLRNIQFALPEAPPIVRGAWYGQELQGAPAAQSSHSPRHPSRLERPNPPSQTVLRPRFTGSRLAGTLSIWRPTTRSPSPTRTP
eukprot:scaffold106775_cov96-Phaeocystis_antarctica.AAC.1